MRVWAAVTEIYLPFYLIGWAMLIMLVFGQAVAAAEARVSHY